MTDKPMTVGDLWRIMTQTKNGLSLDLPVYLECIHQDFESDFMQVMGAEVKEINDAFHEGHDDDNPVTFPALCLLYE
jgi:hypothetical protein